MKKMLMSWECFGPQSFTRFTILLLIQRKYVAVFNFRNRNR